MVNLGNPYDRARPSSLLAIPILYGAAYLVSRYTGFLFAYQYTLSILLTILMSYYFDRGMISRQRIVGGEFPHLGRISIFAYPALLAAALTTVPRLLSRQPVYYLHFSSMDTIPRTELFVLTAVVAVPATELLFRGFIQRVLMDIFGKIPGMILSVIVYGGFFLLLSGNMYLAVIALTTGTLFTYIYYIERSVIAPIISHEIIVLAMFIFRF